MFLCFSLTLALTLRSYTLAFLEKTGLYRRLIQGVLAIFFSFCLFLLLLRCPTLFAQFWPFKATLLGLFLLLTVALCMVRLKFGPRHAVLKTLSFLAFLTTFSLTMTLQGFIHVRTETPLVIVSIPGVKTQDQYLVRLFSLTNALLEEHLVYGELVGIRAKVIRVKPYLSFFGIGNFCKIDLLYSSYLDPDQISTSPHSAYRLSLVHQFPDFLEKIWEDLFFENGRFLWIQSATMESVLFPLMKKSSSPFQGNFHVTLGPSGLSALAL